MESVDTVVIGAGVVGLAVAREVAKDSGGDVVVLEKHTTFGSETSSRNSEVIHAGMYYQPSSLKARLAVEGNRMLYEYCADRGISHKRLTKLIVATEEEEIPQLQKLFEWSKKNGCEPLRWLDSEEARKLEPEIRCVAALLSPATGVVDSHGLMLSLLGEAEENGATVAYGSRVVEGKVNDDAIDLTIEDLDGHRTGIRANRVINAAGLHANKVAASIKGYDHGSIPPIKYTKGNYFVLSGKAPASRLVYPIPVPGGLGIHLTLDLGGRARFGPDTEAINNINYEVDSSRSKQFYEEIRRYWPGLKDDALSPDYCGVRPQVDVSKGVFPDFVISKQANGRLVNMLGVESPGLTSALSLAKHVKKLLK
mmetsp:Transcript_11694/g.35641  ORF Transcript_11694/g.35641 Transcript_11694/m.35641 type:complete len:367 (+) Transcript_11694:170-1270(+)|eukprot:CAMPEP_0198728080 /NCGR_PEP_ID=MMETSP1475-20131203/6712_1 /TAXON_ID= ORGANISM="Unidentified sp., Strain CCMP1999" /NCGR_SAMPLE_ID=MMETSP1475 /ASSEMBLY_ACC=CAM_ASM_001111 /LENGTH=366 /DNA_ID=CAMNT_0044490327 /DNA_START=99 /DNA_END=1199 /DNA_ORIENTATION=+